MDDALAKFMAEQRAYCTAERLAEPKRLERRLAAIETRCDDWEPIIEAYFNEQVANRPGEAAEESEILLPIANVRDSIAEVRQALRTGDLSAPTFALGRLLRDYAELNNLIAAFSPSPGQRRGAQALVQKADQWRRAARAYNERQLQSDARWEGLSKNARAQKVLTHLIREGLAQPGGLAFETVRRCLFPPSNK